MKIAFDLDGVLTPDYRQIPKLTKEEFYKLTVYAKPLFCPKGKYDIITARDIKYKAVTDKWVNQLENPPETIYFKTTNKITAAEYKYTILYQGRYDVYIESDQTIIDEITRLNKATWPSMNLTILRFADFINAELEDLSDWCDINGK